MEPFLPPPVRDLTASLDWKPGAATLSGRAANLVVNGALHDLDRAFASYMGDPPVPSLLTYAKHASRSVGSQLARMEAGLRFLRYFDLNALVDLVRDLRSGVSVRGQAAALAAEFVRNPFRFYRTLQTLRRAIQWGNLQAYGSLVPAFSTFLAAESTGDDGLLALERAGYGAPPLDPNGLVVQAFARYREAHRLGRSIGSHPASSRDRYVEMRQRLAFSATLTLSLHEQMLFQASECYDDPTVRRIVAKLTPTLTIEDPVDTMQLLPDGGNWAEFTDRMGLQEVAAGGEGDVALRDPSGRQRAYRIGDVPTRSGTIFDYLSSRFLDAAAADGVTKRPLPLPAYDDGEGRAIDRLRQSYRRARGSYRPGGGEFAYRPLDRT